MFFKPDDIDEVSLSPSGRWLAFAMARHDKSQRNALFVLDLHAPAPALNRAAALAHADVHSVHWVNDDWLVFSIADRQVASGEDRLWPGLYSVKRDGSEHRMLVRTSHAETSLGTFIVDRSLSPYHRLLHVPSGGGTEVILGEYRWDGTQDWPGIYPRLVDVATGNQRSLARGTPKGAVAWLFTQDGTPRVVEALVGGRVQTHWLAPGSQEWKQIADQDSNRRAWWPREVDDSGGLYVIEHSGPAGEAVFKRFDFVTGQPAKDVLVNTPGFDFWGSLVVEASGGRALGVRTWTDAQVTVWFDAKLKAVQQEVDRRLPGRINRLSCRRCADKDMTVLVRSWSDREPSQYWIWRQGGDIWMPVGRTRNAVVPARMATLDFHRIKARDGRDLPVWVTSPAGATPGKPLPTVVLVHGGPWIRGGSWVWGAMPQFLASRGYLVVEPEFRGSKGYGAAHHEAGHKQWGLSMQDDVADATAWAAARGLSDARRTCIAGGSYGGYSALAGLARHGDLYRCGVAWSAVTDPRLLFKWRNLGGFSEWQREYTLPVLLGDPVADAALLAQASLVESATRIKAPVLLAHGREDRGVPLEHSIRMRDALAAAGNPPEWVVYPGEGHDWQLQRTNEDFARRLEAFLARHLQPAAPAK